MDEQYGEFIAKYRQAELDQRLDMFLACPDLRPEFGLIDQKEARKDSSALLQWSTPSWKTKFEKVTGATIKLLKSKILHAH